MCHSSSVKWDFITSGSEEERLKQTVELCAQAEQTLAK